MPILRDSEDIYENEEEEALSLELILRKLEANQDLTNYEGWISYSLVLREGKKNLVQRDGSIHEDDVKYLVGLFSDSKDAAENYVPLEPDFELSLKQLGELNGRDLVITCFVNHGEVRHAYYGQSAIGVKLRIARSDAKEFAEQLKRQRDSLLRNVER